MIVLRIPKPAHFKARQLEYGMAVVLLMWAANAVAQPAAFEQATWAFLRPAQGAVVGTCLAIAALRCGALYINGALRASPFIRTATACLSGLFWATLTGSIWAAHTPNTGLPVYLGLTAFDLYGAYQASKDARVAWEHAREARGARTSHA